MKKSRYADSQIFTILKQNKAGTSVADLCREYGMSDAAFYNWRSKYGGMGASLMNRLKELEDENRRLKKMYAEGKLIAEIAREAIDLGTPLMGEKSGKAISSKRDDATSKSALQC